RKRFTPRRECLVNEVCKRFSLRHVWLPLQAYDGRIHFGWRCEGARRDREPVCHGRVILNENRKGTISFRTRFCAKSFCNFLLDHNRDTENPIAMAYEFF